jgi:hypothetical protein
MSVRVERGHSDDANPTMMPAVNNARVATVLCMVDPPALGAEGHNTFGSHPE